MNTKRKLYNGLPRFLLICSKPAGEKFNCSQQYFEDSDTAFGVGEKWLFEKERPVWFTVLDLKTGEHAKKITTIPDKKERQPA